MKGNRLYFLWTTVTLVCICLTSCADVPESKFEQHNNTTQNEQILTIETQDYDPAVQMIIFSGDHFMFTGDSSLVSTNGNSVVIKSAGTFDVSGQLNDGSIIIDAGELSNVTLLLNGINISCSADPPIYVKSAAHITIKAMPDSQNHLFAKENSIPSIYSHTRTTLITEGTLSTNSCIEIKS